MTSCFGLFLPALGIGCLALGLDLVLYLLKSLAIRILLESEEQAALPRMLELDLPVLSPLFELCKLWHHLRLKVLEVLLLAVVAVHVHSLYEVIANVSKELVLFVELGGIVEMAH